MARVSSIAVRRARVVESFKTAVDCIGTLQKGGGLFAVTRGQFSMIDAVLAVLEQTGPAAVSLWTWTVAEYEVECLDRLRMDGRITSGRLVIDRSAELKNAGLIGQWRNQFGADAVRYVRNHAKLARVWNREWAVLLRGSFNLNFNPRFEQFDLTEGGADFELVTEIEDALPVLPASASHADVVAASGLGEAWPTESLRMFEAGPTWQK